MNEQLKVSILLATYNGSKYISDLLDSLLNQTYLNFYLYVSDDFSSDDTIQILNLYKEKFINKITFIDKKQRDGTACKNFLNMLAHVDSDVYLFCDQDDIWKKNHIQRLVNVYKDLDKTKPILIHSDLTVVDENLNILDSSFFHYSKLPRYQNKNLYFIQNNVTGCVCLINNELKIKMLINKASFFNNLDCIPMHDNLLALFASYFGEIIQLSESLILYRQHNNNVLGAQKVGSLKYINNKISNIKKNSINEQYIRFFYEQYKQFMSESDLIFFKSFFSVIKKNRLKIDIFFIKNHLLKTGFLRKVKQLFLG